MTNGDYDDCPICQVLKEAEKRGENPTESQMRQAFKEAEKQGAIVGGPLMEEDTTVN